MKKILISIVVSNLSFGLGAAGDSVSQGGTKKNNPVSKKPQVHPVLVKGVLTGTDPFDYARSSSHHKVHNVNLRGGIHYSIIMKASFPPYVRIEDFRGNQLAYSRQSHPNQISVDYTPKENESYRIIATSYSSRRTGQYTITVKQYAPPPPPKMIALVMGKTGSLKVQDQITAQDGFDRVRVRHRAKIYSLKMTPGKKYTIHSSTTNHDGYLRLEDSTGRQLAANDDFGNTRNSRIVFTPAKADTYRIIVTTYSAGTTGPFTLKVNK